MRTQNSPDSLKNRVFSQKFYRNLDTLKDIVGKEADTNSLVHFLLAADGNVDIALNQVLNEVEKKKPVETTSPVEHPQSDALEAVLTQIAEELKCSYCLSYFKDPVILGCFHTFCLHCIGEFAKDNRVSCPLCRCETSLQNGIHELKKNHYLSNIVETIKSSQLTEMCSSCKSFLCSVYCKQCKSVFCVKCNHTTHSGATKSNHEIVPFEERFSLKKPPTVWILPFEINRTSCHDLFRRWVQQLWFAPSDLATNAVLSDIQATYIPFWLFEVDAFVNFSTPHHSMRWLVLSQPVGSFTVNFSDLLICAKDAEDEKYLDGIAPWNLDRLEKSSVQHTDGYDVCPFSTTEEAGWEKAQQKIENLCRTMCQQRLQRSAGHQFPNSTVHVKPSFENKKMKRVFLPVYQFTYTYKNETYRLMINGSTGKIHGERPYSSGRLSLPHLLNGVGSLLSKISNISSL